MTTIREKISAYIEDPIFLEPLTYDEAIIGVAEQVHGYSSVAYDRLKLVEIVARFMAKNDAEDYVDFNIIGCQMGEGFPVIVDLACIQ